MPSTQSAPEGTVIQDLVAKPSGALGVDEADLLVSHLPAATPDNPEVHEGKAWNDFHQARAKQDKLEGKKTSDENRVSKPEEQLAAAKAERDQAAEDLTKTTAELSKAKSLYLGSHPFEGRAKQPREAGTSEAHLARFKGDKATDDGDVDMDPHAKKHIEAAECLTAQARAKR